MSVETPSFLNERLELLGLPMGIVWRLQDQYQVTLVRHLYSLMRPRLSFHGFQISEIQIMQDMFQRHGLRMMNLTSESD